MINPQLALSVLGLLLLFGCVTAPREPLVQQAPLAPEEYRLGVGDVISIRVYGGEEELAFPRIRLNDRRTLTLPFGDFTAYGQTTRELESAITGKLKGQYLLKPRVWVNIEEYRPYFVEGQVGRPGAFPYQPNLTVHRAITIAGGFRERADKNRIYLLRENDSANVRVRVNPGSAVRPGDTLVVEESFF